ncbi:mechanosensitive ion channel [filamentous cyanobacterium LEGE 11480]|uniref:Mechanosensitive ion channel n=1 Tax=Romeriopsis navalis LEGE 11480 TaxID=2777977 RepID=A0A928Z483_9CYAN|nr:mechanosensitive ion channel domain-containing protein [Romeriopsis navalis]MBE9030063.1 mechanosensitive ion channel [Romeriopsis navalis LEGE 11480]
MSKLWCLIKPLRQWLMISLCSLLFVCLSSGSRQTIAQTLPRVIDQPTPQAEVIFEGQTLFRLSNAGDFKAADRAELVMLRLNQALKTGDANNLPQVTIVPQDRLRELELNGKTLLTVTSQDLQGTETIVQQADLWAEQIRAVLNRAIIQRSSDYINRAIWLAIGIFAGTIGLQVLLSWLRLRLMHQIAKITDSHPDNPTPSVWAIDLLIWIVRTGIWIASLLYITNQFPLTRRWSYEFSRTFGKSISAPILTLGNISYTLVELMTLGVIIIAWIIVTSLLSSWLQKTVLKIIRIDRGTQEIITTFVRYSLILVGILVLLQAWGVNISSLAIIASALGLGIGFGLQDLAKNISGGFVLLFERLIQVGDFVEVNTNKGTIERIGTRSTQIRTTDNISIIVPNVRFLEEEVINWSHSNPISRLHIPIGVAYGTDPYQVKTVLLEVADSHADVLSGPAPQVFFKEFGDNSLNFELLVWTEHPDRQLTLISDLNYRIHDILKTQNIEVPFPQRDLHIKSAQLSLSPEIEQALRKHLDPEA